MEYGLRLSKRRIHSGALLCMYVCGVVSYYLKKINEMVGIFIVQGQGIPCFVIVKLYKNQTAFE